MYTEFKNKIYNEDCLETMEKLPKGIVNVVLTSPPYNTSRTEGGSCNRYDVYTDNLSDDEYINWTLKLFEGYDKVLAENGVILYNISYGNERVDLLWRTIGALVEQSNFSIADVITWKKKQATPNSVSPNKLTRITELIYVICRKSEVETFQCNKRVTSVREKTGQKMYENVFNYIESRNNDGSNDLNKATFGAGMCKQLLDIYAKEGQVIYDSFMGTGTVGVACVIDGYTYVGSELSPNQCRFAIDRIKGYTREEEEVYELEEEEIGWD